MVTITSDKAEAAATRASVEAQEAEANAQAARAKEMAADAQRDLDEALPALDAALASLKNLSRCGAAWQGLPACLPAALTVHCESGCSRPCPALQPQPACLCRRLPSGTTWWRSRRCRTRLPASRR
jgi:dynein heavy chain